MIIVGCAHNNGQGLCKVNTLFLCFISPTLCPQLAKFNNLLISMTLKWIAQIEVILQKKRKEKLKN